MPNVVPRNAESRVPEANDQSRSFHDQKRSAPPPANPSSRAVNENRTIVFLFIPSAYLDRPLSLTNKTAPIDNTTGTPPGPMRPMPWSVHNSCIVWPPRT
ncbi:MAG: hypothetical protein JW395_0049 [Nitrospira sp.]|nr:hypothetical protein [Nitrospira sp.]